MAHNLMSKLPLSRCSVSCTVPRAFAHSVSDNAGRDRKPAEKGKENRPGNLRKCNNYRRSVTGQQNLLAPELQKLEQTELYKIFLDGSKSKRPIIRVKTESHFKVVKEFVEMMQEIGKCKRLGVEEHGKWMESERQRVLGEMEKLKTGMSLEDLDKAIESALCSEVEYDFTKELRTRNSGQEVNQNSGFRGGSGNGQN